MTEKIKDKSTVAHKIGVTVAVLLCLILIPLLAANLTLIAKSFISPEKVPSLFGYKPFIVLSPSMERDIKVGDLVIMKIVDPDQLKVGDIIAFREGNAVVTHRIKELVINPVTGETEFRTRGDNNNSDDRVLVSKKNIEGIYITRVSKIGNIAMFLQTPTGLIIFISVPILAFFIYDIIRRRLADKNKALIKEPTSEALTAQEQEIDRLRKMLAEQGQLNNDANVNNINNIQNNVDITKVDEATAKLDTDLAVNVVSNVENVVLTANQSELNVSNFIEPIVLKEELTSSDIIDTAKPEDNIAIDKVHNDGNIVCVREDDKQTTELLANISDDVAQNPTDVVDVEKIDITSILLKEVDDVKSDTLEKPKKAITSKNKTVTKASTAKAKSTTAKTSTAKTSTAKAKSTTAKSTTAKATTTKTTKATTEKSTTAKTSTAKATKAKTSTIEVPNITTEEPTDN